MSQEERLVATPYELRIKVLHAGTRSEGQVGRLLLNGEEVTGHQVGTTIDVPVEAGIVRFVYLGDERPHLWSHSGWDIVDPMG